MKIFGDAAKELNFVKVPIEQVPENLRCPITYAQIWGISDDVLRDELVMKTPPALQENLKQVLQVFDDDLDACLAGPEADFDEQIEAYLAFSNMQLAILFM